ncbi:MAG: hypothetical protein K2N01_13280 [Lachnospiraceae bacterium]|nr:hypothetical protein [Lachnospiraceae bacterium]
MSRVLPILYNTDMVQAILDDRKTATRRLVKPPYYVDSDEAGPQILRTAPRGSGLYNKIGELPYPDTPWRIDDVLYIRETWAFQCCIECMNIYEDESCMIGKISTIHEDKDTISEGCYIYRADHPHPERIIWRPSIHMPKAASRTWTKVTNVRPQRIQDMTLDDFLKEGIILRPEAFNDPENAYMQARDAFAKLWDSTIPKRQLDIYSWEANPWVCATEFERCEKPEEEDEPKGEVVESSKIK